MSEEAPAAAAAVPEEEVVEESEPKDPRYPLQVAYCPVCSMPTEYCEFGPTPEVCIAHDPERAAAKAAEVAAASPSTNAAPQAASSAPAPAAAAPKKNAGPKKKGSAAQVVLTVTSRNKRKFVTSVSGLEAVNPALKLSEMAKIFSKTFSCGSSVVENAEGKDEIDVQGDVAHEMVPLLVSKFGIPIDTIFIVKDKEKRPARS